MTHWHLHRSIRVKELCVFFYFRKVSNCSNNINNQNKLLFETRYAYNNVKLILYKSNYKKKKKKCLENIHLKFHLISLCFRIASGSTFETDAKKIFDKRARFWKTRLHLPGYCILEISVKNIKIGFYCIAKFCYDENTLFSFVFEM